MTYAVPCAPQFNTYGNNIRFRSMRGFCYPTICIVFGRCQRMAPISRSSFHRYVREGVYARDWGGGVIDDIAGGEPS